jgi:glycosyltransferase involved in cell wall biosynthesis
MGQALPRAPVVSVVIPVYNQGSFVRAAIESVLSQDYQPLELIVVDDGSTDATPAVLAAFEDRILTRRQENKGAAVALNEGIQLSSGDLICWLSADDQFMPGKVSAQVRAFEEDPALGLVHTGYEVIDSRDRVIRRTPAPQLVDADPFVAVFWRNPINGSTVMMRRTLFDRVGPFDNELPADVDADMWLRVAQVAKIGQVDGPFIRYRVHGASLSANKPLMRQSMTRVRARYVRDGTLADRLIGRGRNQAAEVLARISAEYAWRGFGALAVELYDSSRLAGKAPKTQAFASWIISLTRFAVVHGLVLHLGAHARRLAWRLRETRRPGL